MFNRTQFHWIVKLQDDAGAVASLPVSSYWDPAREDTELAIAASAKGMAFWKSGSAHKYVVLGVEQVL